MPAIQRSLARLNLDWVIQHPLVLMMRPGIDSGDILPCLRKDQIHFYERGARLFNFSNGRVYTHPRYVGDNAGKRDVALQDGLMTPDGFASIRERARTHRDDRIDSELAAVHTLFPQLAVTRAAHRPGEFTLIDIEARFGRDDADASLPTKMIDLVFLTRDGQLLFVEAKCINNAEVSSKTTAKVETHQVKIYQKHIARPGVVDALNMSLQAQSKLVGRQLGQARAIFPKVPVLILDPSKRPDAVSKHNKWLQDRIQDAETWTPESHGVAIINGIDDPASALKKFAERCVMLAG